MNNARYHIMECYANDDYVMQSMTNVNGNQDELVILI